MAECVQTNSAAVQGRSAWEKRIFPESGLLGIHPSANPAQVISGPGARFTAGDQRTTKPVVIQTGVIS
jgi:hypothetical protein